MVQVEEININKIDPNSGQIQGLPKNPRFIRDERYQALVKSIADFPEMLHLRELIVVQLNTRFVVIGGNMRLRAMRELGFDTAPCKVLPNDYSTEKLREITIKDNIGFGNDDWDVLTSEWDDVELQNWGMELPIIEEEDDDEMMPKEETGIIAISLTDDELALWNDTKKHLKTQNDKNAILALVDFFNEQKKQE